MKNELNKFLKMYSNYVALMTDTLNFETEWKEVNMKMNIILKERKIIHPRKAAKKKEQQKLTLKNFAGVKKFLKKTQHKGNKH